MVEYGGPSLKLPFSPLCIFAKILRHRMNRIKAPSNERWLSASAPGCSSDRCSERPPRTRPRSPRSSRGRAGAARLRPPPRGRSCGGTPARSRGQSGRQRCVTGGGRGAGGIPRAATWGGGWGRPLACGTLAGRGTPRRAGRGPRGCSATAFFGRTPRTPPRRPPLRERPFLSGPQCRRRRQSLAVSPGPAGGRAEGRGRQSAAPLEVRGQPQLPPPPSLPPRPDTLVALFLPSEAGLNLPPRFSSCGPIPPAAAVTSPPDAACEGRRPELGAALPPPMANACRTCCLIDLTAIHFIFPPPPLPPPSKQYCSTVS